ncbi:hypothetical protein LTR56_025441 [Elasticomyces elasticus]|nr:hypothetical protein LTR56_025441 [Elasticomyces elasticus]KAK3652011.1 hypothetical protein LTR22_011941 [Elasticomyces elasticus]KAK5738990.1 hypothetical protein LTS12_025424 [Elasticomyces elasticus]
MADDNSSDWEFAPAAPKLRPNLGQSSIDRIIRDATEDRRSSKQVVKQLEFGSGAQSTRDKQSLWLTRFNAFRKETLKQALDAPFKMDDILRFFESVLNKSKLKIMDGKPGPNDDLAIEAAKILMSYGEFKGILFNPQDRSRLKTFISDAVQGGRLTAGRWQQRTWIGFVTLSRMIRAYLTHTLEHGTMNWDITISRCLGVVLTAALGCRSGDIARTIGYKGTEYMKFRDIDLRLDITKTGDPNVTLADIRATVTIPYAKGYKNRPGESAVKYLNPLLDPESQHVCPIALLLAHSLRNGLIAGGKTLQQVLNHAARRLDHKVVWTFPDRPVLPLFVTATHRLDLDRPATPKQTLDTMKQLGLVSGMLDRIYTHALRAGSARDLMHVPRSAVAGYEPMAFDSNDLRLSLGHSMKTYNSGTTNRYTGDPTHDYYGARASAQVVHRNEPSFAADSNEHAQFMRAPITEAERASAIDLTGDGDADWSSLSAPQQQAARKRIHGERERQARGSMITEPKPSGRNAKAAPKQHRGPVLPLKLTPLLGQNPIVIASKERSQLVDLQGPTVLPERTPLAELSVNPPRFVSATEQRQGDQSVNVPPKRNLSVPLQAPTFRPVLSSRASDHGPIDPVLLSSGGPETNFDPISLTDDSIVVDSGRLSSLCDAVFPDADVDATAGRLDKGIDDEAARLFLGTDGQIDRTSLPSVTNLSFVDAYAQYNVVCNEHCSVEWKKYDPADVTSFDATIGRYCMRGNSRDDPTPFLYFCKKTTGCTYQTTVQRRMTTHENDCTPLTVESIAEGAAVLQSLSNAPDDDPRVCPRAKTTGCTFKALGKNPEASVKSHLAQTHDYVSKPCKQGCFPDQLMNYRQMLTHNHKYHNNGRYPAPCTFPDCNRPDDTFSSRDKLKWHLRTVHGLEDADARKPYFPAITTEVWSPQPCLVSPCKSTVSELKTRSHMLAHLVSNVHQMDKSDAEALIDEKASKVTLKRNTTKAQPSAKAVDRSVESTSQPPAKRQKTVDSTSAPNEVNTAPGNAELAGATLTHSNERLPTHGIEKTTTVKATTTRSKRLTKNVHDDSNVFEQYL